MDEQITLKTILLGLVVGALLIWFIYRIIRAAISITESNERTRLADAWDAEPNISDRSHNWRPMLPIFGSSIVLEKPLSNETQRIEADEKYFYFVRAYRTYSEGWRFDKEQDFSDYEMHTAFKLQSQTNLKDWLTGKNVAFEPMHERIFALMEEGTSRAVIFVGNKVSLFRYLDGTWHSAVDAENVMMPEDLREFRRVSSDELERLLQSVTLKL